MVTIMITRGLRSIRLPRGVGNERNAFIGVKRTFCTFCMAGSDPAVLLHTPTTSVVHTQIKSALNCKSVRTTPTSTSILR